MADWIGRSDVTDLARVEIVSMEMHGRPSSVRTAVLRLVHLDGSARLVEMTFANPPVYETLEADVAAVNAMLRRRR